MMTHGTVIDDNITHACTEETLYLHYYARTACGIRFNWNEAKTGLEPKQARFAVRTEKDVDCMACIAVGATL